MAAQLSRFVRPVFGLRALCMQKATLSTSACSLKASEPAYAEEHTDDGDAFQSKISEVLKLKEEDAPKLWCSKNDLVIQAVTKMTKFNVGSLLVFDPAKASPYDIAAGKPTNVEACCGIVTERDYLTKVVVEGKNSYSTKVSQIMTPHTNLRMLTPHHSVLEAMELMISANVRHVPVMDEAAMVGVLSIKDVVKVLLDDQRHEIHVLKDYIHGTY